MRHVRASQLTPEPHPHREPAIFRMRDLIHTHHRSLHRFGSPCARSRARPAMSIASVVSDAHACGPSVYLGGGDAERARIRLIGRSKTARCNWRSDFRKQVFPLAHAHAPLFDHAQRRGPKLFFGNRFDSCAALVHIASGGAGMPNSSRFGACAAVEALRIVHDARYVT